MASPDNIKLAHYLASVFETKPEVQGYLNEDETAEVDILRCKDSPQDNVTSFATLGPSDLGPKAAKGLSDGFGVEIVASIESNVVGYDEVLSTCALSVMSGGIKLFPGSVIPNAIDLHKGVSNSLTSIVFSHPFFCSDKLLSQEYESKTVTYLRAIPISDGEMNYLHESGFDALESKFIEHQIDVFDVNRVSLF